MEIQVGDRSFEFRPWRERDGRVFHGAFALDTETTAIDDARPWLAPAYVLGGAFDGTRGVFVLRDQVLPFLSAHDRVPVVMHNAAFDLDVLHTVAPEARVYDRVDRNEVYDTQLLHRLRCLGEAGHTAAGRGEATLDRCAELYLGVRLPKDVRDAAGRDVRTSYGIWLNRPPGDIERPYLEYLARDAVATYQLFGCLQARLGCMLGAAGRVWGYVSPAWLEAQVARWGWQTHHIQLRAAVVLRAVTANGLALDTGRRAELAARLRAELDRLRRELAGYGYLPGQKGSGKALQAILRQLERDHPDCRFPRTPTGQYATARDALEELADRVPFLRALAEYAETEKLLACFVGKMARPVVHPSFNVLARTGRTTSYGELNAQNLPRSDAVRGCFVPSPGHVFLKADYATIELATLGQAVRAQFGLRSRMAEAINAGQDLHRLVAAKVTRKPEGLVTADDRQRAKPINFGKPGAMGLATLRAYARASYGVALTEADARGLSDAWLALFPEMVEYLRPDTDRGADVARLFGLTPAAHHAATGSRKFVAHPANAGRAGHPHPILGQMLLKVLGGPNPATWAGAPYDPADVAYFWAAAAARPDAFPDRLYRCVRERQPSPALRAAVVRLAGRAPVFTLTGRLRADATFAARRNTVFQGLASDGAKLALWNLWRAGYRVVNFVHDEVLVEVPAGGDLRAAAEDVRRLMVAGMRAVVPDVRVDVEYAACARWYKGAKAVPGPGGAGLALWEPPPAAAAG